MGGATALDHDVLLLAGGTAARETFPNLPDVADLDGLARRANGRWLLSFDVPVTLGGQLYRPADVVEYNPMLTSYALAFDSDTAAIPDGVDTDAVAVAPDGTLVLSFDSNFGTGPLFYRSGDLVNATATQLGSVRFDALAAGLAADMNVDSAAYDGGGQLVLSFDSSGSVGTTVWQDQDLVARVGGSWRIYARLAALDDSWDAADLDALDITGIGDGVFCNGYE